MKFFGDGKNWWNFSFCSKSTAFFSIFVLMWWDLRQLCLKNNAPLLRILHNNWATFFVLFQLCEVTREMKLEPLIFRLDRQKCHLEHAQKESRTLGIMKGSRYQTWHTNTHASMWGISKVVTYPWSFLAMLGGRSGLTHLKWKSKLKELYICPRKIGNWIVRADDLRKSQAKFLKMWNVICEGSVFWGEILRKNVTIFFDLSTFSSPEFGR